MKNRFYMKEFQYHDGECYVTFNIVDLNELKNEISVAITREGRSASLPTRCFPMKTAIISNTAVSTPSWLWMISRRCRNEGSEHERHQQE